MDSAGGVPAMTITREFMARKNPARKAGYRAAKKNIQAAKYDAKTGRLLATEQTFCPTDYGDWANRPTLTETWRGTPRARTWWAEYWRWRYENPDCYQAWSDCYEEDEAREREKYQRNQAAANMREAGAPAMYIDAVTRHGLLERRTEAVKGLRTWQEVDLTFLVLLGGVGSGKTYAAVKGLYDACTAVRKGIFVTAKELSGAQFDDRRGARLLEEIGTRSLAVIDDVGLEQNHAAWRPTFEHIVDHRYANKLKTIITSNCTEQQLRLQYGERVYDRLRSKGMFVQCGSQSLRERND